MVQVKAKSIEAKILKVLLRIYPVDSNTVSDEIGIPLREVDRILKGMEKRGWISLERLPDRTFIRLRRTDFTFLGREETQRKAVKHKRKDRKKSEIKKKLTRDEHDDMMYA
ncbi:MAG: hypothetical protein ACMUIG_00095 [Thermoplasmatota archaeon]